MVAITSIAFRRVSVPPHFAGKAFGMFTFDVISLFLIICLVLTGTEKKIFPRFAFFLHRKSFYFFSTAKLKLIGSYF